jgi:hypothetical protein
MTAPSEAYPWSVDEFALGRPSYQHRVGTEERPEGGDRVHLRGRGHRGTGGDEDYTYGGWTFQIERSEPAGGSS